MSRLYLSMELVGLEVLNPMSIAVSRCSFSNKQFRLRSENNGQDE